MALVVGDKVPWFILIRGAGEVLSGDEIFADGPSVVTFYLFDFTGDDTKG